MRFTLKLISKFTLILLLLFLIGCDLQSNSFSGENSEVEKQSQDANSDGSTSIDDPQAEQTSPIFDSVEDFTPTANPSIVPSPTATPDPLAVFYDCQMQIEFLSGPLESQGTSFLVLNEDYFSDKGDLFAPGKGTAVYYVEKHYFILHSSYFRGNILRPMEAEFVRKYLENWGGTGETYIQEQIDILLGSEVLWSCDKGIEISTKIDGVVRLSHEASDRLWLEPRNIDAILADREGLVYEWVGGLEERNDPSLLMGFCGWGPESLGDDRFTYYRYLISFEVLDLSNKSID